MRFMAAALRAVRFARCASRKRASRASVLTGERGQRDARGRLQLLRLLRISICKGTNIEAYVDQLAEAAGVEQCTEVALYEVMHRPVALACAGSAGE